MALPQSLLNAASAAAGTDEISYIGGWQGLRVERDPSKDPMYRPLINAAPGVCVVCVKQGESVVLRPFIWTEELSPEAAALANAMYDLGITENLVEAATALSTGGV